MIDVNKRLLDMTAADIIELITSITGTEIDVRKEEKETKYVYGLPGIAELFRCSISTALKIKNSGNIDEAVMQLGNKIVVDAEKALELAKKTNKK